MTAVKPPREVDKPRGLRTADALFKAPFERRTCRTLRRSATATCRFVIRPPQTALTSPGRCSSFAQREGLHRGRTFPRCSYPRTFLCSSSKPPPRPRRPRAPAVRCRASSRVVRPCQITEGEAATPLAAGDRHWALRPRPICRLKWRGDRHERPAKRNAGARGRQVRGAPASRG